MTSFRLLIVSGLLLILAVLAWSQQVAINQTPIKNVFPASTAEMYAAYCSACHGTDGKGTGPAATALKTLPADLTMLTRRNNGSFPTAHVYGAIFGDNMPAAHGRKDMPVWGGLFYSLSRGDSMAQAEVELRVSNLTTYVKSLQR